MVGYGQYRLHNAIRCAENATVTKECLMQCLATIINNLHVFFLFVGLSIRLPHEVKKKHVKQIQHGRTETITIPHINTCEPPT